MRSQHVKKGFIKIGRDRSARACIGCNKDVSRVRPLGKNLKASSPVIKQVAVMARGEKEKATDLCV